MNAFQWTFFKSTSFNKINKIEQSTNSDWNNFTIEIFLIQSKSSRPAYLIRGVTTIVTTYLRRLYTCAAFTKIILSDLNNIFVFERFSSENIHFSTRQKKTFSTVKFKRKKNLERGLTSQTDVRQGHDLKWV